jgi:hypothetical protein
MNALVTTAITCGSLVGALLLGFQLRRRLPEHHLSSDSKDAVKLAMGLVATMTALILGLLVSSAKGSYDADRNAVVQMAAKVAFLDRLLALYGPEAAGARDQLRSGIDDAIRRMWPDEAGVAAEVAPDEGRGDALYVLIQRFAPRDDVQRALKTQTTTLMLEIAELRTLLLAQSIPSISPPLLGTVICWLVIIFLSFALLAPPNTTTVIAMFAAALAVSGAVFLILELDHPFDGVIRISKGPMAALVSHMAK